MNITEHKLMYDGKRVFCPVCRKTFQTFKIREYGFALSGIKPIDKQCKRKKHARKSKV